MNSTKIANNYIRTYQTRLKPNEISAKSESIKPKDSFSKNNSKMYIGSGIFTAIITGVGAFLGNGNYKKEKNNLESKFKTAKSNAKNKIPESLKKIFEQIEDKYIYLTIREQEGKKSVFPNCLMIEGENQQLNEYLVQWTKKHSKVRVLEVNYKDDLVAILEKNGEHYEKVKQKTLLHVKGLENLISPKKVDSGIIASMKSIMTDCAEEYNTTMIFTTKNSKELDHIAIQPHRVKIIKANVNKQEFKVFEEAMAEVCKVTKKLDNLTKSKIKKGALIGLGVGLVASVTAVIINNKKKG